MSIDKIQEQLTHNTSVVIAFHKLLKAARDGVEVFLLDSRDSFAGEAMQAYNDAHFDKSQNTVYGQFVDQLSGKFHRKSVRCEVAPPKCPSDEALIAADRALSRLLGSP